ncbi:Putative ATPase subunit of terminase (gpP-like) [[Clostridium] symbiosum]|uniref:ATPase subunit of terminase (GpP-like) n=1 Tax=Clostridium symbiosum TaxID=1512 RepID=A0A6N3EQE1_CLOSY|nr:phage terminase small subunit [[Clostridium] symbiosum]MDM8134040.1 phage terminase small subunit [[Clostridium] symbiosum]MDM8138384.1 phage terminase small subunit [[Clostridium] symbiosum]MDM8318407.1 phage terminase small subunit [[Clostridium] symbiosum]
MARAPDARAEQAKELFLSGKKLIEISEALGIPEGTVRSWKNRYGWEGNANATLRKPKCNVAKRKGGQPGNKNAIGNRGGAAPENNKNAVTTGEFETLLFDCLEPDELQLVAAVPTDKERLLLQEIQLLTVRERRMLKRIEDLRDCDFTTVKKKKGTEKDKWTDLKEDQAVLGQIQSIEDALTRVQGRKQRAIESLHKFGFDDARLEIELMKVELATLKIGGQEAEQEDDGFLAALNTEAESLWEAGADDN